jgi:hypothetical protein
LALRRGQPCPTSGGSQIRTADFDGIAQGAGPVRPLVGDAQGVVPLTNMTQHPGWLAEKSLWFSEPRYQGPFLVRVRRLDGAGPAGLSETPTLTAFYIASTPTTNAADGYREVPGATWVKTPGCIAWQVDGLTFSKVIVVRTVCRAPECIAPRQRRR